MNKETEIIEKIIDILPKSKFLQNNFFESDAEILHFNNKKLLFSIDEFSQEDFFDDTNPYILGRNVCIATISDVFASGGKPLFFSHSLAFDHEKWDTEFIEEFTKGIADVLNTIETGFIGGDLGVSQLWKYTGVVIGESQNPITRIGATEGDLIYMTGQIGAGNMEAAKKIYLKNNTDLNKNALPSLKLNLRYNESKLINKYATSCIDTSDGVLNALNTISDLNHVGFNISKLPYSIEGIKFSELLSLPKCLLFMGECGEYELLFTIRNENKDAFLLDAKSNDLSFNELGLLVDKKQKILQTKKEHIDLLNFDVKARDYKDISDYLSKLINYVNRNRK